MPKPEVIEEKIEPKEDVVIELNEKGEEVKAPEKPKEEPKYVKLEDLEKERNRFFYKQRQLEGELQELRSKLSTPAPEPQKPQDELDELLQKGDWRTPVTKLAEKTFAELRQKELQEMSLQAERARNFQLLEDNKRKVIERHPELNDPNDEKTIAYQKVVSENPAYLSNPFGPVLAMRDMEDRLRSEGKYMEEPVKDAIDKEVLRRTRTSTTTVPKGTVQGNSKVVLSKDERDLCDAQGIKYEVFAKMKSLRQNGGVETQ